MSAEEIVNEDLLVKFTLTAGPPDKIYLGDQGIDPVKIVPVKSLKNEAVGKKICTQKIDLTFTAVNVCPFTSATYTFVGGIGLINATAIKVKAESKLVLRKGDIGTCVGAIPTGGWTLTASPFTALACACDIEISNAGQTKDKAK